MVNLKQERASSSQSVKSFFRQDFQKDPKLFWVLFFAGGHMQYFYLPISVVYATWSGLGIFLITVFGYFVFQQSLEWRNFGVGDDCR